MQMSYVFGQTWNKVDASSPGGPHQDRAVNALEFATASLSKGRFYLLDLYGTAYIVGNVIGFTTLQDVTFAMSDLSDWWREWGRYGFDGSTEEPHMFVLLRGECECGYFRQTVLRIPWRMHAVQHEEENPSHCFECRKTRSIRWKATCRVPQIKIEEIERPPIGDEGDE